MTQFVITTVLAQGGRARLFLGGALLCFVTLLAVPVGAALKPVGILLSKEITPYVKMVEGLEYGLAGQTSQRLFLDKNGAIYSLEQNRLVLDSTQFSAFVAVGPEALRALAALPGTLPLFYGMVLNPDKLNIDSPRRVCGVSLNISIETQLQTIIEEFHQIQRIGILFDPANNQSWYDEASAIAASLGIELVPFQVRRIDGRLDISGDFSLPDAILFIPDKTIISKTIVQHIIKLAALQQTPVVGYNQFFFDSGAALSFIIDYARIGRQVAALLDENRSSNSCEGAVSPIFSAQRNMAVWRALQRYRQVDEP